MELLMYAFVMYILMFGRKYQKTFFRKESYFYVVIYIYIIYIVRTYIYTYRYVRMPITHYYNRLQILIYFP